VLEMLGDVAMKVLAKIVAEHFDVVVLSGF
jgi:hypothetical protein